MKLLVTLHADAFSVMQQLKNHHVGQILICPEPTPTQHLCWGGETEAVLKDMKQHLNIKYGDDEPHGY